MAAYSETNIPQPPKQSAYTQPSNPVSQDPLEQRGQPQPQQLDSTSQPSSSLRGTGRRYGDAPAAIHRTADSKPASDDKLAKLEQDQQQKLQPEYKRGHIDLEYGVEQQPAEGDIAAAVEKYTTSSQAYSYSRVQPGVHAGAVGSSTPGFEQDTAAQMDRKRAEHDRILAEKAKSPGSEGEEAERRQLRERKLKQDEQLDVKGAVKASTGDPAV